MRVQGFLFAFFALTALSAFSTAAFAEISTMSTITPVAVNIDANGFSASYTNISGGAVTPVEGGACNFTLYFSNGSAAGVFPSEYFPSGVYYNSSTSFLHLGFLDNYSLTANCSATGFDSASRSFGAPVEVLRAGIRFYELDSYGASYTRYDTAEVAVGYFDSINSSFAGDGSEILAPITPVDSGACTLNVLNATTLAVLATRNTTYNSTTGNYEFRNKTGPGGLNLSKGSYLFSANCSSSSPDFEARSITYPFSVVPLTCAYVAVSNLTLEENIACTGDDAAANPSMPIITLAADNVKLDCAGYSITGPANHSLGIGGVFASGVSGLVVNNCTFYNLWFGTLIDSSTSTSLANLTVNASSYLGIGSTNSTFTIFNTTLTNNNASLIFDSSNVTLQTASVTNSTVHGVAVYNSTGSFSTLTVRNSKIGMEVADSQGTSFSSLTFSGNGLDLFLTRGTALVIDLVNHVFTGVTTLASLASWDYTANSSRINNTNSSIAIATFTSLTLTANGATIAYGELNIANGTGVNWTSGVVMNSTYVSISPSLASALDKAASVTLTGASYANTTVFEVRSGALNCTTCVRLAASPARFSAPSFFSASNYTTVAVAPPAGNDTNGTTPTPTPTPTPTAPSTPSGTPAATPTETVTSQTNLPTTTPADNAAAAANANSSANATSNLTNSTGNSTSSRGNPFSLTGLFTSGSESLAKMSAFLNKFVKEQPFASAGVAGYVLLLFAVTTALKLHWRNKKPSDKINAKNKGK